jgi:hypothetical protein
METVNKPTGTETVKRYAGRLACKQYSQNELSGNMAIRPP